MLAILGFSALLALGQPTKAAASHCVSADKLKLLEWGNGDSFRNFDFDGTTVNRCNVDWPVTFLFWNNAEVNKIKNRFDNVGYGAGIDTNRMAMHINDGAGFSWDEDAGRKNGGCAFGDVEHYRVYGIGADDRMYSMALGYYVYGTTHIDHNECNFGSWSGMSEDAEGRIADDARNAWEPSRVDTDALNFYNSLNLSQVGSHRLQNNGLATTVKVGIG